MAKNEAKKKQNEFMMIFLINFVLNKSKTIIKIRSLISTLLISGRVCHPLFLVQVKKGGAKHLDNKQHHRSATITSTNITTTYNNNIYSDQSNTVSKK